MNDNPKPESRGHYDLSEEASKRGDEEATRIAREVESDDINEETGAGKVNPPEANNRVATSISED